jgi:hypothetical protein
MRNKLWKLHKERRTSVSFVKGLSLLKTEQVALAKLAGESKRDKSGEGQGKEDASEFLRWKPFSTKNQGNALEELV